MSKAEAVIQSEYPEEVARVIAEALQADNACAKGTKIATKRRAGLVITRVRSLSIEKLLPVVDDLLSCQSLCERTLNLARKQRRETKAAPARGLESLPL